MARTKTPAPKSKEVDADMTLIGDSVDAANALAVARQEADARTRALAATLRYEGALAPDALENGAREAIRRINMGVFELGAYLLLLRESCPHGELITRLERLDLHPRAAQQYMQVTRRFSNAKLNSHFEALGKTKMVEMLVLDDEQLEELALTGQTGELALDDVATMSVKELRAALREARAEGEADKVLLEKKNAKIDKLERDKRRIAKMPADEAWAELQREATAMMNDARGAVIGGLRQAILALRNAHPEEEAADVFMAGLVGQVQADVAALREEFSLPDVSNAADLALAADVAQWNKK